MGLTDSKSHFSDRQTEFKNESLSTSLPEVALNDVLAPPDDSNGISSGGNQNVNNYMSTPISQSLGSELDSEPEASSDSFITRKLEDGTFSPLNGPRLVDIDGPDVYINGKGPYQDELEAFNESIFHQRTVFTPKLKTNGYKKYSLFIGSVSTKHFRSMKHLEALYSVEWEYSEATDPGRRDPVIEEISFSKALEEHFDIKIFCNMEYYQSNLDELRKDLGSDVEITNLESDDIKKELFFKVCLQTFGDLNDEEEKAKSTVILRDFRVLFFNESVKFATARRGDRYILFCYEN